MLIKCLDQSGRNVLQRAVKAGSFTFAKLLTKIYKRQINSTDTLHKVLTEALNYVMYNGPFQTLLHDRQNISRQLFSIRNGEFSCKKFEKEIKTCPGNKDSQSYLQVSGDGAVGKITIMDKLQKRFIDVNTTSLY